MFGIRGPLEIGIGKEGHMFPPLKESGLPSA